MLRSRNLHNWNLLTIAQQAVPHYFCVYDTMHYLLAHLETVTPLCLKVGKVVPRASSMMPFNPLQTVKESLHGFVILK